MLSHNSYTIIYYNYVSLLVGLLLLVELLWGLCWTTTILLLYWLLDVQT